MNDVLCNVAAFSIFFLPRIVAISIRASTSSLAWNKGNLPTKKNSRIMPADQTSTAWPKIRNFQRPKLKRELYLRFDRHISIEPLVL
jgi:hypothetical protein